MGTVPYTGFYVELSAECSINSTPRMAGSRPICPPGPQPHKLASARPGAVRAPPGGLGPFQALAISTRARLHAHVARFGPRGPPTKGEATIADKVQRARLNRFRGNN